MNKLNRLLGALLALLAVSIPVMAAARPHKSDVRTFEATYPSVESGADVTASKPVKFDAVCGSWDNPSIKWQRHIMSDTASFTIADTKGYGYTGPAYMSFVTRTTLRGTDILWVVVIKTPEEPAEGGCTTSIEFWIGQEESEGLVTSYDKVKDIWYVNFNGAGCTVYRATTTPAGFRSSVKLGDGDPKSFSMTIQRT